MAIEKRTFTSSEKAKAAIDELGAKGFKEVKASFKPDKVLVAVTAPFGDGAAVAKILDSHGGVATSEEIADEGGKTVAAVRPFDFAKWKDSPTPLSDFFGWSVLKNDYKSPFWPEALSDDPTPLSTKMGWSVLSVVKEGSKIKNPATPLSDLFGWSVLKNDYKSPFWPEALMDDPTPLSNKFGWTVLKDK
ncbi:hypothetical protein DFR50_110127 [Roseiarcus fermentans]|uniref:Uncharacterized protein n=1 Tax=Roseiarcus fermentans TaxID=1473586 RepID=A0A366FHF0_9HYPH|nr:hypothetical protein [Roseiarcus fermentans]RBP14102.1 hypothetical protein DFR50_110127 [Roseiarcus fermentans]